MSTKLPIISTYQYAANDVGGSAAGTVILKLVYYLEIKGFFSMLYKIINFGMNFAFVKVKTR
jgi:hypothetical protein